MSTGFSQNIPSGGSESYTVYTALLTQEATDDPVDTVLENTTGRTATWSYVGVGEYLLTFSGSNLDRSKTFILLGWGNGEPDTSIVFVNSGTPTITLKMYQSGVAIDEELFNTSFEVRIYP